MTLERWWRNSLKRPLLLLVVVEAVTTTLLLLLALFTLRGLDHHLVFIRRFSVAPVIGIDGALDAATQLSKLTMAMPDNEFLEVSAPPLLKQVQEFGQRYRAEWQVVDSDTSDAKQLRSKLASVGRRDLLEKERDALRDLEMGLDGYSAYLATATRGPPAASAGALSNVIDRALRELLGINVLQIEIAHACVQDSVRAEGWIVGILGVAAIAGAALIGITVRRAIAPRIHHLVECTQRFQQEGVYEPIADPGNDDLTVLAHALDAGFASISAHERAHERFLSIVAHELKTPVTSIQGFAEVARGLPPGDPKIARALEVVHRNARRLRHLIEDILLAARARTRDLPFDPRPIDLAPLVRRTVNEVQTALPTHPFVLHTPEHARVLGDAELLSHALWSLLTSAAHVAAQRSEVEIALHDGGARQRLEIRLPQPAVPADELESAMTPFGAVGYEDGAFRNSVGLALCREIARLHGGSLRIVALPGAPAVLTLELPT